MNSSDVGKAFDLLLGVLKIFTEPLPTQREVLTKAQEDSHKKLYRDVSREDYFAELRGEKKAKRSTMNMDFSESGFVYLVRNKDLYKIGITKDPDRRMRELKPDEVIHLEQCFNYAILEKCLHSRFKSKRLPQTEYFRLSHSQVGQAISMIEEISEQ